MKFKIIYILSAILLFVAIAKLPSEYYLFLRIAVFVAALLALYEEFSEKGFSAWVILFVVIGLIFNPIMPIYLYDKGLWISIDLVSGIVFLLFAFSQYFTNKKKNTRKVTTSKPKQYNRDKIY